MEQAGKKCDPEDLAKSTEAGFIGGGRESIPFVPASDSRSKE